MSYEVDPFGNCMRCGKHVSSTGGCQCYVRVHNIPSVQVQCEDLDLGNISQAHPTGDAMACIPAAELASLRERLAAAERERDEARGAMRADDRRLREAEARVLGDGDTWGCDAPEHFADMIIALRERLTRAEADGAAMRQLLREAEPVIIMARLQVGDGGPATVEYWRDFAGRVSAALASDHPGADLLARATAAEAVVEALRTSGVRLVDATAELVRAWEAYDARVQECAGDSETGRLNKEE